MNLRTLTAFERACARDAFVAIFPGPDGIGAMDVDGYVDDTFRKIPLEPVIGLRLAIWIVALAPIFVLRRLRTLRGIAPSDREVVLLALTTNRVYAIRQLVMALKAMAALLYAGDPKVRARLLAPPPPPLLPEARIVKRILSTPPPAPVHAPHAQKEDDHAAVA